MTEDQERDLVTFIQSCLPGVAWVLVTAEPIVDEDGGRRVQLHTNIVDEAGVRFALQLGIIRNEKGSDSLVRTKEKN